MQERRILLSKNDVKSLGTELTALTTEPIKILYVPINALNIFNNIIFKYWSSSSDTSYTETVWNSSGNERSVISDLEGVQVKLAPTNLLFTWKFYSSTTNTTNDCQFHFSFHYSSRLRTSLSSSGLLLLRDHLSDIEDVYIRIDITKVPTPCVGGSFTGKFFLKYFSGEIPADTIFYEPGTYE